VAGGARYRSTAEYLAAMCELVLTETGLLPHANAGTPGAEDLALLCLVTASQGMMIESLRDDLAAHRGAPDRHQPGGWPPWRRQVD
jgi:FO synthase